MFHVEQCHRKPQLIHFSTHSLGKKWKDSVLVDKTRVITPAMRRFVVDNLGRRFFRIFQPTAAAQPA